MKVSPNSDSLYSQKGFEGKTVNSKQISASQKDLIYNKSREIGVVSIFSGVAAAFVFRKNVNNIINSGVKFYNKMACQKPVAATIKFNTNGPDITIGEGKTAISDAWDKYINSVEKRINSHKNYQDIFTKNATELNRLEKIVQNKEMNNIFAQVA